MTDVLGLGLFVTYDRKIKLNKAVSVGLKQVVVDRLSVLGNGEEWPPGALSSLLI